MVEGVFQIGEIVEGELDFGDKVSYTGDLVQN